jgi:hypothetical protein
MFAVERVPRFRMVEHFRGWIPVHHREIDPVVIRVALDTGCPGRAGMREGSMKSLMLL